MENKIGFIGAKNTTREIMEFFLSECSKIDYLVTIKPETAKKFDIAGYEDLTEFCKNNDIEIKQVEKFNMKSEEDLKWFREKKLTLMYCVGWARLIPEEILEQVSKGIFGFHGSVFPLPKGKGRSPLNWAMILGENEFRNNLFKYESGVDSGHIADTSVFEICDSDLISDLQLKTVISGRVMIKRSLEKILSDNINLTPQEGKSSYFPKRIPSDGEIDWNLPTRYICRLVKAVSKPFSGAFSSLNNGSSDEKIKFWNLDLFSENLGELYVNYPNGYVVYQDNRSIIIKGGSNSLLVSKDFETNSSNLIGSILKSASYEEQFRAFETRYRTEDVHSREQMEVTLEKFQKKIGVI